MEEVTQNPDLEEAEEMIQQYLRRNLVLQINGLCRVKYQGRAKSKLDRGERMVIKKEDSAFLVHGPDNYQPKNWQPEVDKWTVKLDEEELRLKAERTNPEEIVEVIFEEIDLLSAFRMVDKSELQIKGDEVDIHEAIEEDPEIIEDELKIIEREYKNPAGYIDVLARDKNDSYVVVEVKRNPDHNTVLQLQRYIEEIEKEYSGKVRGILAAPKTTDSLLNYLQERDLEFAEIEMKDVIASYEEIDNSQSGLSDF